MTDEIELACYRVQSTWAVREAGADPFWDEDIARRGTVACSSWKVSFSCSPPYTRLTCHAMQYKQRHHIRSSNMCPLWTRTQPSHQNSTPGFNLRIPTSQRERNQCPPRPQLRNSEWCHKRDSPPVSARAFDVVATDTAWGIMDWWWNVYPRECDCVNATLCPWTMLSPLYLSSVFKWCNDLTWFC